MDFRSLARWGRSKRLRLMRYVSLSKLERLESDVTTSRTASFSIFGTGASFSTTRTQGIQSRVDRVENALRRQKLLGTLSSPGRFQFLICELPADEFVAQGVAVWVSSLEHGYVVSGGSATYLDRNIDVFTSRGVIPGSNPSGYYAGLAAIYRQALNLTGERLSIPRLVMESWPANAEGGSYLAEADPDHPANSPIWRIDPRDEVIAKDLDLAQIFNEAEFIHLHAGDPWRGKVRQLLLVHTDHTFETPHRNLDIPTGARLVVGSPLYVEQLTPTGDGA